MAIVGGPVIGFFYHMILKVNEYKIKYAYIALSLFTIILVSGLIDFKAGIVALVGIFIGTFLLVIGMMVLGIGKGLQSMFPKSEETTDEQQRLPFKIVNYYPAVFHTVIVILMLLSMYILTKEPVLTKEKVNALSSDMSFQFNCTLLMICIGIFNPFISPSQTLRNLANRIPRDRFPRLHELFSKSKAITGIKIAICTAFVAYFIAKGYLSPTLSGGGIFLSGIMLFTGIYLFTSLYQLIKNPDTFFKRNVFRTIMLVQSAFAGLFVTAIIIVITMLTIGDSDDGVISSETMIFLGFNIVMAFNEFKIARVQAD